jgi:purine-binding chemotaxis protein CheW
MTSSQAPRRVVRCTIGAETYCIDNEWLDSIHVIENLYPRKGQDGSIGWIRRFDEKVPVYRLADQLSRAVRPGKPQGVILVIEKNDRAWALLVDKVTAASQVVPERVFPMPAMMGETAYSRFPWVIVDSGELTLNLAPDFVVPAEVAGVETGRTAPPAPPPVFRNVITPKSATRAATGAAAAPAPAPQATAAVPRQTPRQIVTFALSHREKPPYPIRFAVSAGQALEIVNELPMIQVPEAPPFASALASWRSLPVPVVDLGSWLGLPSSPYRPGARLLVCRAAGGRGDNSLIAIPGVEDIRKLDLPIACTPWSEGIQWNVSLALGVYLAERGMLVVPDLDAIIGFQAPAGPYRM